LRELDVPFEEAPPAGGHVDGEPEKRDREHELKDNGNENAGPIIPQ
jgi:hypothetical protein